MHRRSPFEPEFHEEEENHPRMKHRKRARLVIIISAVLLVPLSAILLIIAMMIWKFYPDLPEAVWVSSILHPFLTATVVMLAMTVHRYGHYTLAIGLAVSPVANLGYLIWLYLGWD